MNKYLEKVWDFIVDNGIVSEETLRVVTSINGYNETALNDIIYVQTGYRDMEQYQRELYN